MSEKAFDVVYRVNQFKQIKQVKGGKDSMKTNFDKQGNEMINKLATQIQAEGTESIAFYELFNIINHRTIEPKVRSYKLQLKGDIDAGISEAYKVLMKALKKWNGSGSFHTYYKTSLDNSLRNLVKKIHRKKRSHNTNYDISLSETSAGEEETENILEVAKEKELQVSAFDITDEAVTTGQAIALFAQEKPEQAEIIAILFDNCDEKKHVVIEALADYFGITVDQYTNSLYQKRVSRSREAFRTFINVNNLTFKY